MRQAIDEQAVGALARAAGLNLSPQRQQQLLPMLQGLLHDIARLRELDRTGFTSPGAFSEREEEGR